MKFFTLATAAALALTTVSAPVMAQDAALTVGAKIYGPDGAEVGTIQSVNGEAVVVNTGNITAALPASSFGKSEKGPTIGWNKAELEAAVSAANQESAAELAAALVVGADVYSSDAVLLGKVQSIGEDGSVVVELASGPVALPGAQMALQNQKLTFRATAADVQTAAAAAQGGTADVQTAGAAAQDGADTAQGGD